MNTKEMISVIQAFEDGKVIQAKVKINGDLNQWHTVSKPYWDFIRQDYRIKPEPLRCWANVYENGNFYLYRSAKDAMNASNSGALRRGIPMIEEGG